MRTTHFFCTKILIFFTKKFSDAEFFCLFCAPYRMRSVPKTVKKFSTSRSSQRRSAALLLMAQMLVLPSWLVAAIILQTSPSASIRNCFSLSSVTRSGLVPICASTVRPTTAPDGIVISMCGTCDLSWLSAQAGLGDKLFEQSAQFERRTPPTAGHGWCRAIARPVDCPSNYLRRSLAFRPALAFLAAWGV